MTGLIGTTEAAERLGVSRQRVLQLVDEGRLQPAQRVGKALVFDPAEVAAVAERRAAGGALLIGYARVSTGDQHPEHQVDQLLAAGCSRVFVETASGAAAARPELAAALDYARDGDTLAVVRLDRLGRSLRELIDLCTRLDGAGVHFRSLRESIDTGTPAGRLFFHLVGAVAEFERDLIRERTLAGLTAARARGRTGGRPSVMTAAKLEAARVLIRNGHTMAHTAKAVGVGRTTLYRALAG